MKKKFISLACIVSTFLATTSLLAEFNQETIHHVKLGETFEINLPANMTAGYSWYMGPFAEQAVEFLSSSYRVNRKQGTIGLVGQGGTRTFTFKAIGVPPHSDRGRVYLNFLYVSPARSATIAKQQMYQIVINR